MTNIIKAPKIISHPKPSHIPIIKEWIPKHLKASCGCGEIKNEAYLYSNAEQKAYCDTPCLVDTEAKWVGEKVLWMDRLWTVEQFKEELEVISYG